MDNIIFTNKVSKIYKYDCANRNPSFTINIFKMDEPLKLKKLQIFATGKGYILYFYYIIIIIMITLIII